MRSARTAQLITAPTYSPLNMAEMRDHVRVDHTDDDPLLAALAESALDVIESNTWRKFRASTWEISLDCFPSVIELPFGGLSSVTSITYVDDNGASQVLASSEYQVDTARDIARITPAYDTDWPSTRTQMNAISVRFVCGADSIPIAIRQAMLLLVGHFYENREASLVGISVAELPIAVDALIEAHKVVTI